MAAQAETVQQKLSQMNYSNIAPLIELSDAFTFDAENVFFHTVDGCMWRMWRLGMFADDVISEDEMLGVSTQLASVINQFPEGSAGKIMRFTHNDIRPILGAFAESQSSDLFAEDVLNAIIDRQILGATKGFMQKIDPANIQKAMDELQSEVSETDFKDQLSHSLDQSITIGQYAYMSDLYLAFRYTPNWSSEGGSMLKSLKDMLLGGLGLIDIKERIRKEYKQELNEFTIMAERIEQTLLAKHFSPERVTGQGFVELMFRELNPERSLRSDPPVYSPKQTLREQIFQDPEEKTDRDLPGQSMFTPLEPTETGWKIDDMHYVAVSLAYLPRLMSPGMLHNVLKQYESQNWVVINFYVDKQYKVRNRAAFKAALLNSKQTSQRAIPLIPKDEKLDAQRAADLEMVQSATNKESQDALRAVEASIHVVLKGRDLEELTNTAKRLEVGMWEKGYFEKERGDAIIHHCMPLNFRRKAQTMLSRSNTMLSPFVADMAPLYCGYQGINETGVLLNNEYGSPIFVNQLGNHVVAGHTLTVGGTGSGKSFFVNNVLQQYKARQDMKIVMIDKGRSYESTCEAYDGQYIDLVLDEADGLTPVCINPYHIPPTDDGQPRMPSNEEIEFLHSMMLAMAFTGKDQGLDISIGKNVSTKMLEGLKAAYNERKGTEQLTHGKLLKFFEEHYGDTGQQISDMLSDYSRERGAYGSLFDGELEVDWSNPFLVVETDRISATKAMPVCMMVLFYQVNTYFKYKLPKNLTKIIGIDEAWAALANPTIASAITGYILELRKYKAFVWLISQTIGHFESLVTSAGGDGNSNSGLLENIKHFFLLACSHNDHVRGQRLLNMSDQEIGAWASLSSLPPYFSECFYRYINKKDQPVSGKVRLYSNSISLWMSTTDPDDKPMRDNLAKKYMDEGYDRPVAKRMAIAELAEKYPYGSKYQVSS